MILCCLYFFNTIPAYTFAGRIKRKLKTIPQHLLVFICHASYGRGNIYFSPVDIKSTAQFHLRTAV